MKNDKWEEEGKGVGIDVLLWVCVKGDLIK